MKIVTDSRNSYKEVRDSAAIGREYSSHLGNVPPGSVMVVTEESLSNIMDSIVCCLEEFIIRIPLSNPYKSNPAPT